MDTSQITSLEIYASLHFRFWFEHYRGQLSAVALTLLEPS
jgi:hypothetical protein